MHNTRENNIAKFSTGENVVSQSLLFSNTNVQHLSFIFHHSLMKAVFTLCILAMSLSTRAQTDNYIFLTDGTGFDSDRSQFEPELEAAATDLVNALPEDIRRDFKVYDFGFYLNNEVFADGYEGIIEKVTSNISASRYLLLARGMSLVKNQPGEHIARLNLGTQTCISNEQITQLEAKIELQASSILINNENVEAFYEAEKNGIAILRDLLQSLFSCCESTARNTCVLSILSPDEILQELYNAGYQSIPITIESEYEITSPPQRHKRATTDIVDCSTTSFSIDGSGVLDVKENLSNFFSTFDQDYTIKVYITDDKCYSSLRSTIQSDFENNSYDIAAHFHITSFRIVPERPPLISFYDYSSIRVEWCDRLENVQPHLQYYYSLLQFAGDRPIRIGINRIPEEPGVWELVKTTWTDKGYFYKALSLANERSIPVRDMFFYSYDRDWDWWRFIYQDLITHPDGLLETLNLAVLVEDNDPEQDSKIHTFTNATSGTKSNWFGYKDGIFNDGNAVDAPDYLFWVPPLDEEPERPYIDSDIILDYRTFYNDRQPILAGIDLTKLAKLRALYRSKIKAMPQRSILFKNTGVIYKIVANASPYVGKTARKVEVRFLEHLINSEKKFGISIDDLLKSDGALLEELIKNVTIPIKGLDKLTNGKQIYQGLEQMFIVLEKSVPLGHNKIYAFSRKNRKLASKIDDAVKWLNEGEHVEYIDDITIKAKEVGYKSFDDFIEKIKKYDFIE